MDTYDKLREKTKRKAPKAKRKLKRAKMKQILYAGRLRKKGFPFN